MAGAPAACGGLSPEPFTGTGHQFTPTPGGTGLPGSTCHCGGALVLLQHLGCRTHILAALMALLEEPYATPYLQLFPVLPTDPARPHLSIIFSGLLCGWCCDGPWAGPEGEGLVMTSAFLKMKDLGSLSRQTRPVCLGEPQPRVTHHVAVLKCHVHGPRPIDSCPAECDRTVISFTNDSQQMIQKTQGLQSPTPVTSRGI